MPTGLKRSTSAILLAATIGLFAGCDDTTRSDKQVTKDINQARQAEAENKPEVAVQMLNDAVAQADASPGSRALANAALARTNLDSAERTIATINRKELDLSQLIWEISQLGIQIRTGNTAILGYRQYSPKPAQDAIAAKIAEAEGGPNQSAWFTHGTAVIPTLAAVTQDISKLEGQLAQKQDQLKKLTDDRNQKLDAAEKASAQADQAKGEASLEPFKKAADLRKQAGDLAVQIDQTQKDITRLQRDLSVDQGQQTAVKDVIAQLKDQNASIEQAWTETGQRIASQQQISAEILGTAGGATTGPAEGAATNDQSLLNSVAGGSIAQKAANVARMVDEIAALREKASTDLNNAASLFGKAYRAAEEANSQLQSRISDPKNAGRTIQLALWRNAKSVNEPLRYKLQQALAMRKLGQIKASEAMSLADRISAREMLTAAINGTNLKLPSELQGANLDKARQDALTAAEDAYKQSDDLLAEIVEGRASDQTVQPVAQLERSLTQYGWSQVAQQAGNAKGANDHLQAAIAERNKVFETNPGIVPTAMPAGMGEPPKPAPAPAAETPSTQPDEAAPATTAPADAAPAEATPAAAAPAEAAPAATPPAGTP